MFPHLPIEFQVFDCKFDFMLVSFETSDCEIKPVSIGF